jgi:transcriptional regulator with XRE-family HTH domain
MAGPMSRGRPEQPIVGFGPVARFAAELRSVRYGSRQTYPTMGAKVGCSAAALSQAANGRALPKPRALRRYLIGCGVESEEELVAWDERLAAAARAAAAFAPELTGLATVASLTDALVELVDGQGLEPATLGRRLLASAGAKVGKLDVEIVSPREIARVLTTRAAPLTVPLLGNIVFASGGTAADVEYWQANLRRLTVRRSSLPGRMARASAWARRGRLVAVTALTAAGLFDGALRLEGAIGAAGATSSAGGPARLPSPPESAHRLSEPTRTVERGQP